jgi:membrane-associated protein
VFLESGVFFALPADSLLFTAGLLVSALGLNIYFLISFIFIATFLGAIAGYYIGFYLEKLQNYSVFRKILKKEHLGKTHEFFEKHGAYTIFISRFVPIVRTFTPIVAGVAHMDKKLFIKSSLLSGFVWSVSIPLLGFFLGRTFPAIKNYLTPIIIIIVLISLIPVVVPMLRKKSKAI